MEGGRTGTNNLTASQSSAHFTLILIGKRRTKLPEGCEVNGIGRYWHICYLVDGIDSQRAIFLSTNYAAAIPKEQSMMDVQEARQK